MNLIKVNLWRRLAAALYDSFLLMALYFVLGWIAVLLNDGLAVEGPWMFWILLLVSWAFFVKFWCRPGQTLGMQVWKIKVVAEDGRDLSLRQASARFVFSLVSWAVLGMGFLWCLIDKNALSWHDKLSDTKLIYIDHKKNK
ncbi:RDD family protein [Marinomonas algicola]|uniref:RDD family protein n=1 Tax=Marinomonas algicola TaxID=2773454 RepID=UPI001749BD89|nr:RDD family protein [Marinomonas algicola]